MKKVFFCALTSLLFARPILADNVKTDVDSLNFHLLQEVEIISSRAGAETPVAYSDLNRQKIEENNFGQDIPWLLTLTPSVIMTSDAGTGVGYSSFRIRGTDANRINITANGIPLNDSESHTVFWVNMPDFASSLQDLQVQRGVGTSTNGAAAFGASVNMKTENLSSEPYAAFNGSYGSFNTTKATVKVGSGTIGEHFAFDARLSSITSDGYIDRAEADLKSYFVQGAYFGESTLIRFTTFGGKEKTYHAWDGVPYEILKEGNRTYNPSGYMGEDGDGNQLYYPDQTDNYEQTHYHLNLLHLPDERTKLNLSLHYTRGAGYYEEYKSDRKLKEYGLKPFEAGGKVIGKSDLIRQKHLDNDFGGAVFSIDHEQDKWNGSLGGAINYYDGKHFGKVTWTKNYAADPDYFPPHEYYRNKGKKADMNIYLRGNYHPVNALNIYADIQYRHIDYRIKGSNDKWDKHNETMQGLNFKEQFNFFNPKAGLFYAPDRKNKIYASLSVAHREPNRRNYTDSSVKELPRAERLLDYELGYKYTNQSLELGLNLYYMEYKDQLVLTGKVNEIGEPLTSNVPDSYRTGMEVIAGIKITEWLKWEANLTWSKNQIKDYTEYVTIFDATTWEEEAEQHADYYGKTRIAYSPDLIANSLFSFRYRSFSAAFHSNYVSKQYLDNTENDERSIDSWFVNNLRLGYNLKINGLKEASVNIQINNLFDEKYENNGWLWSCYYRQSDGSLDPYTERNYFPQAGTNFLVNLSLRF